MVVSAWAVGLSVSAAMGASQLRFDTGTTSFIDRSGPEWAAYQRSSSLFGGDEFLTVVVRGREPFSADMFNSVEARSEEIAALPGVRRADSITSYPLLRSAGASGIRLTPVWSGGVPAFSSSKELKADLARDPIAQNVLVAKDGLAFAINAVLDGDIDGPRAELVDGVYRSAGGRGDAIVSGVPVFRTEVNRRVAGELLLLIPATLVVIGFLLWVTFRSASAITVAICSAAAATVLAASLMGASGVPLSLSTMTLPPILLALGSAYSAHVIAGVRASGAGDSAVRDAHTHTVALSAVTTALGFSAMMAIPVEAIWQLGLIGAAGALASALSALTLGPALLFWFPLKQGGGFDSIGRLGRRMAHAAIARPRVVAASWCLASLVAGAGVFALRIDTDIIRWFPDDDPVREAYESIRSDFSGITPMNVMLEASDGRPLTSPSDLRAAQAFSGFLLDQDEVGFSVSVADLLARANEVFAGVREVPSSRELAEQYLSVLSNVDLLSGLVTDDRSALNLPVRMDVNGSGELLRVAAEARSWWKQHGAGGVDATVTGIMYEFARAQQAIAKGQIRGLAVAFLAIAAVLALLLGSIRGALLASIPNVLPIVIAFGLLGWIGLPLDAASACIGMVALGIAVDDTVHVSVWYRALRRAGREPQEAMGEAVARSSPVLLVTTAMIALGFGALGMSSFAMVGNFGLITASVVVLCLVANLSLLPVLLAWNEGRHKAA